MSILFLVLVVIKNIILGCILGAIGSIFMARVIKKISLPQIIQAGLLIIVLYCIYCGMYALH